MSDWVKLNSSMSKIQLQTAIKKHNKKFAFKVTGNKAVLAARIVRANKQLQSVACTEATTKAPATKTAKKRITPMLVKNSVATSLQSSGGGSKGQKTTAGLWNNVVKAYGKLDNDANPNLAFGGVKKKKAKKKKVKVKGRKNLFQKKK